jgi:hypothetical protein
MVVALQLLLNTLRLSAAGGPAAHAGHWTSPPCAGTSSKSLQPGLRVSVQMDSVFD